MCKRTFSLTNSDAFAPLLPTSFIPLLTFQRVSKWKETIFLPSNDIVLILLCLQHSRQVGLLLHLSPTWDYQRFLPSSFVLFKSPMPQKNKGKSILRVMTVLQIPRHYNKHPSHTMLAFCYLSMLYFIAFLSYFQ